MNAKPPPAKSPEPQTAAVDRFRARHLALAQRQIETEHGRRRVLVDERESPLAWLARRRGRDRRALIEPHQFHAGERLRAEFTRAHLMPRTTSNWTTPISTGRRNGEPAAAFNETVIASRQRLRHALEAVGPGLAGVLLDVCCFLKGLEDIERDRAWPARSAKVVLQLGLDRLARHYGYGQAAYGRDRAAVRTWLAEDASFSVEI